MRRMLTRAMLLVLIGFLPHLACINARAPDIYLDRGPAPEPVNSAQVPPTTSHEQARAELEKAYGQIRYLESENRRLTDKVKSAKADADEYKEKYKQLKKKYGD